MGRDGWGLRESLAPDLSKPTNGCVLGARGGRGVGVEGAGGAERSVGKIEGCNARVCYCICVWIDGVKWGDGCVV